jgi:hypothetical protein
MEYLVGIVLGAAVCVFALLSGFDRERVFYPTLVIVVATYYLLFAAMANSMTALAVESAGVVGFTVVAVAGFKKTLWLAAAGLAGHGVFDSFHHALIQNPGVPVWWPGFCGSFDVFAGVWLGILLMKRQSGTHSRRSPG